MDSLTHRKWGVRVEFDYYCGNGIMGAHPVAPRIKWESIYCVIGYPKTYKVFSVKYGITVGFEDKKNDYKFVEVLSTNNEWEYRYFLEKMVSYLKRKYGAMGGDSWCSIFAEENMKNYYESYICCRTLADKVKIGWFEQNDYEHSLVATDFINKILILDGNEVSQIWDAILKLRLQTNKDGSFALNGSQGYHILYNHFIELQSVYMVKSKEEE